MDVHGVGFVMERVNNHIMSSKQSSMVEDLVMVLHGAQPEGGTAMAQPMAQLGHSAAQHVGGTVGAQRGTVGAQQGTSEAQYMAQSGESTAQP